MPIKQCKMLNQFIQEKKRNYMAITSFLFICSACHRSKRIFDRTNPIFSMSADI